MPANICTRWVGVARRFPSKVLRAGMSVNIWLRQIQQHLPTPGTLGAEAMQITWKLVRFVRQKRSACKQGQTMTFLYETCGFKRSPCHMYTTSYDLPGWCDQGTPHCFFLLVPGWSPGRWLQSLNAFDTLRREWIEPDSWTGVKVKTTREMCRAP